MNYIFKVIDDNTGDIIKIRDTKNIQKIEVKVDTVEDNVSNRSNNILYRVTLIGNINDSTSKACEDLMAWSLTSASKSVHRRVEIEIKSVSDERIRQFSCPNMFCEDYIETFSDDENKNIFQLTLIQKAGYLNEIVQSSNSSK